MMTLATDSIDLNPVSILVNQFHEALAPTNTAKVLLLLDPSLKPLFNDDLNDLEQWELIPLDIYKGSIDPQFIPRLLPLNTDVARDSEIIEQSIHVAYDELQADELQQGNGRQICAWFVTDLSPAALAKQWGANTQQRDGDGDNVLFRLYDPRVLWLLWQVLDSKQQSSLLNGIQQCWILNPLGQWQCLTAPQNALSAPPRLFINRRDHQWQAINNFHIIHDVFRYHPEVLEQATAKSLNHICQTMQEVIQAARRYGISTDEDLTLFALHGLRYGKNFHLHPRINILLKQNQKEDLYIAQVDELTESDWRKIKENN